MSARKPIVAGNWKMNKNIKEARELIQGILPEVQQIDAVEIIVCPPFVCLEAAKKETEGSNIKVGAQNMHWEAKGAFTGEISAAMLVDLCQYVIIGHSERRAMFGEINEMVNKKIHAALQASLKPIMCVGETLEENQAGKTAFVVEGMVREGLKGVDPAEAENLVIAYEPVWAIGTGLAATPEGANTVQRDVIRPVLRELFGEEKGNAMRILYGGSVTPANAAELFAQSDIDGGLIGGASLKADSFAAIVKAAL